MSEIKELIGKILLEVVRGTDPEKYNRGNECIFFKCEDGDVFKMYHSQDCCENVSIDDIEGDLNYLVGSPILVAEEVSNPDFENQYEESFFQDPDWKWNRINKDGTSYPDSHTWTFYKLATLKGYVTIRWFGSSNGFYSEYVSFEKQSEEEL